MLDLQEYGVTKKWVIITEISKEVENNSIARLNAYARQYVSRSVHGGEPTTRAGNGGTGDHIQEVVVLDVLDPVCVYTFICVEIKKNIETVALGMFQKVTRTLMTQTRLFCYWEGVFEGRRRPDFFSSYSSSLSVLYYQLYESMTGPIGQRVMT